MMTFNGKSRAALAALTVALILGSGLAEARMGRSGSFGSRGARTWSAPPATSTAPSAPQPIQRSVTPGSPQVNPGFGQSAGGGIFGRPGFMGGLFGGLLGAGLLGMLFGGGFFGGLTGGGSILGLMLQLGLAFVLIRCAMRAFAGRTQTAAAGGPGMNAFDASQGGNSPQDAVPGRGYGVAGLGRQPAVGDDLAVGQAELDRFEQLLTEIQTAYGREDLAGLRRHTTPEMLSYLAEELTENASRGVVNRVSDIKLLSGDVAESWREGGTDFVTVAMRYSLSDVTENRETGQVVENGPSEATELWTFRRATGGDWLLAALQQT